MFRDDIYIGIPTTRNGGACKTFTWHFDDVDFEIYVGQYDGVRTYTLHIEYKYARVDHKWFRLPTIHVAQDKIGEITNVNLAKSVEKILSMAMDVRFLSVCVKIAYEEGVRDGIAEQQNEIKKALGLH